MNIKEEIEVVLKELKYLGFDRRTIERELKYSARTIDQTLVRGGNEKMLIALREFLDVQKALKIAKNSITAESVIIKVLVRELATLKAAIEKNKIEIPSEDNPDFTTEVNNKAKEIESKARTILDVMLGS